MTDPRIGALREALQKPLPGALAQALMAPSLRLHDSPAFTGLPSRSSAVMILLFPASGGLSTVFIHRTQWGPHGGQISLPGGRQEPEDEDLIATAYRESAEEIGLIKEQVETLGVLTPLYVPHSHFVIQPVVAYTGVEPLFCPDRREVESIVTTTLNHLFDPEHRASMLIRTRGVEITAPYYEAAGYRVWGATAMIMSEFEQVVISCISG